MREYLYVLIVALVVTYLVTPAVRRLALRVGAMTPVRSRDVHAIPVPRMGGVAMLAGFAAAALVASRLPFLSQIFAGREVLGVLLGGALICALGALDDIFELDWLTKMAGQVIASGAMALAGVQLLSLPVFGVTILPAPVMVALTILVVVTTTNAINFVDGLDGLAAGIVAISALAFLVWSYLLSHTYNPPNVFSTATFVSAALAGVCLGFLPHNFHRARLFMGDAGALLLGLLMAAAMISLTGSIDPSTVGAGSQLAAVLLPIAFPLAILTLPLLDMALAIVRRTRAGMKPWHADAKHLHHQMLRIGHGHREAVLILYLWSTAVTVGVLAFAFVRPLIAVGLLGLLLLLAFAVTVRAPAFRPGNRL